MSLLAVRATETLSTRGSPSLRRDGVPPRAGALGRAYCFTHPEARR
jgi:hypothetical protein